MATRQIDLLSVYEYDGLLSGFSGTLIISGFTGPSAGSLLVDDQDNERDWDSTEPATYEGEPVWLTGTGTATVGITLPLIGTVNLGSSVPVEVFTTGGSTFFHYPDGQPSELLDGLATMLLGLPLIGTAMSLLGITDLTAYVEQNALLNFNISSNAPIPLCFTRGTMIETPDGLRAIESLDVDDHVVTCDHGAQAIRWIARRVVPAIGRLAPIRFAPGALDNEVPLELSPQHRVLIAGYRAQLYCGEPEILAPAKTLVNGDTIHVRTGGTVEYFHLLFDNHEIVFANGVPCESLYLGQMSEESFDTGSIEEVRAIFPELGGDIGASPFPPARPFARGYEARLLLA